MELLDVVPEEDVGFSPVDELCEDLTELSAEGFAACFDFSD